MDEKTLQLAAAIERALGNELPRARPKLRLITAADLPPRPPRTLTDEERTWQCDEIRLWCGVYPIEPYVRRRMRGCTLLESLNDDTLRDVFEFSQRCVQAIRDEVPFDEAGIF